MSDYLAPLALKDHPDRDAYVPTEDDVRLVRRLKMAGLTHKAIGMIVLDRRTGRPMSVEVLERVFAEDLEMGREICVGMLVNVGMEVALDPKHRDGQKAREFFLRNIGGAAFDKDLADTARAAEISKGKATAADAIVAVRDIIDMIANDKRTSRPETVVPSLEEMRAEFQNLDGPVIDLEVVK